MPSNLNALLRYKTINSCLYGGRRKWSIDELIDACSEALGEARGRYERISERTIRDDIRVMRSDMLGFSAPIQQEKGLYFYADPHYSILSVAITDMKLVDRIIKMLLDIRTEVKHPELEIVLERLMKLSPDSSPVNMDIEARSDKTEHLQRVNEKIKAAPPAAKKAETSTAQEAYPNDTIMFSLSPSPSYWPEVSWGDLLRAVEGH
jgi:hypothetical protein